MGSARKGGVRTNHPSPSGAAAKLGRNLRLARTAASELSSNAWLNPWPEVQILMSEVRVRLDQCQTALAACQRYIEAAADRTPTDNNNRP